MVVVIALFTFLNLCEERFRKLNKPVTGSTIKEINRLSIYGMPCPKALVEYLSNQEDSKPYMISEIWHKDIIPKGIFPEEEDEKEGENGRDNDNYEVVYTPTINITFIRRTNVKGAGLPRSVTDRCWARVEVRNNKSAIDSYGYDSVTFHIDMYWK